LVELVETNEFTPVIRREPPTILPDDPDTTDISWVRRLSGIRGNHFALRICEASTIR